MNQNEHEQGVARDSAAEHDRAANVRRKTADAVRAIADYLKIQESPDSIVFSPVMLLLCEAIPLAALFLLMGKDYAVVHAQMTQENLMPFWFFMTVTGILAAAASFHWLFLRWDKKRLTFVPLLVWLFVQIVYSFFVLAIDDMHPNVEPFILPSGRWLLYFLTFTMIGLMYFLTAVSMKIKSVYVMIASVIMIFAVPFGLYLFFIALSMEFPESIGFSVILLAAIGFMFAVVFFMVSICRRMNLLGQARFGFGILISLVLPCSGLLLNYWIPFPVNLQTLAVYALTVVNAVVLLIPVSKEHDAPALFAVFLKGATAWFPVYFCMLFLPFIPLFPLAVLAFGMGFLILTPTLLFLYQTARCCEDWCSLSARMPKSRILTAFFCGLLVIPGIFFADAYRDKRAVENLVKTYFESPYVMTMEEQYASYDAPRVTKTLMRLYQARNGIELPFLSEIYNRIVFGGMVLSQDKIDRMIQDFCDFSPTLMRPGMFTSFSLFPSRNQSITGLTGRRGSDAVRMTKCEAAAVPGGTGARLTLEMVSDVSNAEFSAKIRVPDGILVNGLTLSIDGKQVPGRITEKKTAFWIYEKITMANRDPALLSWTQPGELRLLVSPVSDTPRTVTVDFLYAGGCEPEIMVNDQRVHLPKLEETTPYRWISPEELAAMPAPESRIPELVFILDRRLDINHERMWKNLQERMRAAIGKFPAAKEYRVVSGMFAAGAMLPARPVSAVNDGLASEFEAAFGAKAQQFAAANVVRGAILQWHETMKNDPKYKTVYPVFVLISNDAAPDRTWNLQWFADLLPDFPALVYLDHFYAFKVYPFEMGQAVKQDGSEFAPREVRWLENTGFVNPERGVLTMADASNPSGVFASAEALWLDGVRMKRAPEYEAKRLRDYVAECREKGILTPQTAYLVLETEAQWNTLAQKEAEKLKRSSAFDIEEVKTDEPPLWAMFAAFVLVCVLLRLLRRRIAIRGNNTHV